MSIKKLPSISSLLLAIIFITGCNQPATQVFENTDAMVEFAKANVTEIPLVDFKKMYDDYETFVLIDVRSKVEYDKSFIPGALNIERGLLEFRIAKDKFWEDEMLYMPLKDELIILCCKKGHRGALAAQSLKNLGYTNVKNLEGGVENWKQNYPDLIEMNEVATGGAVIEAAGGGGSDDGGC